MKLFDLGQRIPQEFEANLSVAIRPDKGKDSGRGLDDLKNSEGVVAALASSGIVQQAARSIGKSMEALYKLRARPGAEGFAAAWDEALGWGVQWLEDCALERAMAGVAFAEADAMLCFVLERRSTFNVDSREVVPGHPLYERIRDEVLAEVPAPWRVWGTARGIGGVRARARMRGEGSPFGR